MVLDPRNCHGEAGTVLELAAVDYKLAADGEIVAVECLLEMQLAFAVPRCYQLANLMESLRFELRCSTDRWRKILKRNH